MARRRGLGRIPPLHLADRRRNASRAAARVVHHDWPPVSFACGISRDVRRRCALLCRLRGITAAHCGSQLLHIKKVNRSVRLQHGRARARMSERARVIAPQASGMGSSPGTSSPRGIPCREPWYWTALQPQPANSTERSRVGQRCPGWAAWVAGVVRWPRRTQAPPSGPSKSRAALRGIKYFIRGF